MNDFRTIAESAKKAIDLIDNGDRYTSDYVKNRFVSAADRNPRDQLIAVMRDVVISASESNDYITQNQIGSLYDEMYGLSGGKTSFREELGDLLPKNHNVVAKNIVDYSKNRIDVTADINTKNIDELNDLSDSFASIFSLNAKEVPGLYSSNISKRAEDMVRLQLGTIDCIPSSVSAVSHNEHFILCVASYDHEDWTVVDVKIPVQITNNVVSEPTNFIEDGVLSELNKENMYVHIKDSSNRKKRSSVGKFAQERQIGSLKIDQAVTPKCLERFTDLDSELVAAASKFTTVEVNNARNVLRAELSAIGILNSQIKVHGSDDRTVILSARIPSGSGGFDIVVPIEIHAGTAILPSKFFTHNNGTEVTHNFTIESIHNLALSSINKSSGDIARDTGSLQHMSYHELMDDIIDGVSDEDYKLSEDALIEIDNRYGSDHYTKALDKFSSLLKTASLMKVDDKVIKKAFADGYLINIPTSVEPYCPSLGLLLSKISFDDKGRPFPKRRSYKSENLKESGAHMSTHKIVLT